MANQKMCEACQESPATVHLTEMANSSVVLERHLCDTCAAKQGVIGKHQMSLVAELLGNLKQSKGAPKPKAAEPTVASLEKELEKLVKTEDYEKAAKLRDQIRELKAKKETKE